jgi:tRNA(Ile)-lysidine synthase
MSLLKNGIKNLWLWAHVTSLVLLSAEWISRLQQFERLLVGLSGGLDSTVLLHVLASNSNLRSRLSVVHVNHGLSEQALDWQIHCEQWCSRLKLPFIAKSIDFCRFANIEKEARTARYAAFSSLISAKSCLLLGHHLDDQAETLLLHLVRGAGVDGLAAMREFSVFAQGHLARPLLAYSRQKLHDYASQYGLQWVDDGSNYDTHYSRNYLRHHVMPLLAKRWPGVVENLSRTALHCQQGQVNLDELALDDCPDLRERTHSLRFTSLLALSESRAINVLRVWLRNNNIQMPTAALLKRLLTELVLGRSDSNPEVMWNEVCIRRYQDCLYSIKKGPVFSVDKPWGHFPKPLVLQEGAVLCASVVQQGLFIPEGAFIEIRYRRGGELFIFHGQTKSLRKLWQEWKVPLWVRSQTPLLYINTELAAVIGYAISDSFYVTQAPAWELTVVTTG